MPFTIDLDGLRSDTNTKYIPPATDSPTQKRLYYLWRGLLGLLEELYGRMEPYIDFAKTTGFSSEEDEALFEDMVAQRNVLAPAANWAAIAYGNCELLEGDEPVDTRN